MNNVSKTASYTSIIFRDAAEKSIASKYASLFPGFGFAAGYKIIQRIYKFGGQPIAKDFLTTRYGKCFEDIFASKSKVMIHATAGSIIGVGEVVLLPLDILKIKMQTNPNAIMNRNIFKIIRDEGFGLYKGATWTAGFYY